VTRLERLGAMGGMGVPGLKHQIQHQSECEALWLELAAVIYTEFNRAKAEVARRQELFAKIRHESPRGGEPADLAALRSVIHDATYGRLA
jgi:hypothetical protein